jgi:serine phosphatase RsbU (regulator of sigma subunit)
MKSTLLSILFFCCIFSVFGQSVADLRMDTIPLKGLELLQKPWRYQKTDDMSYASISYNDANWKRLNPRLWMDSLKNGREDFENIAWFRYTIEVDSTLYGESAALQMHGRGAAEVYWNGKKVREYGKVSPINSEERKYDPRGEPITVTFSRRPIQVIAVRFSNSNAWELRDRFTRYARTAGFRMNIRSLDTANQEVVGSRIEQLMREFSTIGVMLALGFLHLCIFAFYPAQKANLFYGLASLCFGFGGMYRYFLQNGHNPEMVIYVNIAGFMIAQSSFVLILRLLYAIFEMKVPPQFWLISAFVLFMYLSFLITTADLPVVNLFVAMIAFEGLRVIYKAVKGGKQGAWLIGSGVIIMMGFNLIAAIIQFGLGGFSFRMDPLLMFAANLSISIVMSIYLARDISWTNKALSKKLIEVQELSELTIEQQRVNRQILENQNEELERQVKQRTLEIQEKNAELGQQNEEILMQRDSLEEKSREVEHAYRQITDSVRYAQRIQRAILGDQEEIISQFKEAFILFKPRNIVSGDFFWYNRTEDGSQILIAADCTGHGVPGAFMTVMGNDFLEDIIFREKISKPCRILEALDEKITNRFGRKGKDQLNDGMDMGLMVLDRNKGKMWFAGAKNPMLYVRNGEIHELAASKFPIGSHQFKLKKEFNTHELDIQEGDAYYLFSDGFQDQFGGEKKQKYLKKRFREFLLSISHLPMSEQREKLDAELEAWKSCWNTPQTDDVLVMGVRI